MKLRSQFEHCSIIWRPKLQYQIDNFEQLQKRAIKWILNEDFLSYADIAFYYTKCKQLNLLPLNKRFELNDLLFFHKIVFGHINVNLPPYITRYTGKSKLRSNRLDRESFVYVAEFRGNSGILLYKSFYFRVMHLWNDLTLDIRTTRCCITFKNLVTRFIWAGITAVMTQNEDMPIT